MNNKITISLYEDFPNFYFKLDQLLLNYLNKQVIRKYSTNEEFRRRLVNENISLSSASISNILRGRTFFKGRLLRILVKEFSISNIEQKIVAVKSAKSSEPLIKPKIKFRINKNFARIIGNILGDGGLTKQGNPIYANKNKELISHFERNCKEFFGNFNIYKRQDRGVINIQLPTIIGKVLVYVGVDKYKKRVPIILDSLDKICRNAFISAIYDDEGSISNRTIIIEMTSRAIINRAHSILKESGISPNQIKTRKRGENKRSYYFRISGREELIKFNNLIGFLHPEKTIKLIKAIKGYKIKQRKKGQAIRDIISILREDRHTTKSLMNTLNIKAPCLSYHLKKLRKQDLIEELQGRMVRDSKGRFIRKLQSSWKLKNDTVNNL